MRFPPGVDAEKAIYGYVGALQGFPIEAITSGIRRFLRGECDDVSMKFCPHPPELAAIVRNVASPDPTGNRFFSYRAPKSKILERNITKDYARRLVDNGVYPRGSIWTPSEVNDRPDIGDLFAPDEKWAYPKPVNSINHHEHAAETGEQRARMSFKLSVLSKAIDLKQVDLVAEANARGLEDIVALAQRWGVEVPGSIWAQLEAGAAA